MFTVKLLEIFIYLIAIHCYYQARGIKFGAIVFLTNCFLTSVSLFY